MTEDRKKRLSRAKKYLNKHFKQGFNMRWTNNDAEVKSLARMLPNKK